MSTSIFSINKPSRQTLLPNFNSQNPSPSFPPLIFFWALMEELGSIWLYQEDDEDLKKKLQSTRMELEGVRQEVSAAKEETIEKEKQLNNLLQVACKDRDMAREQLHILLNKINPVVQPCLMMIPSSNSDELNLFVKQQLQYPIANSSITESNTLSDPFNNNQNEVSSPVDSIFDAVTSPAFSTLNNLEENQANVGFVQNMGRTHPMMSVFDHATAVIEELIKGKILPQKGKLLEAVMEAGPLLQTLMLAGPLPRWRNPPPLLSFITPHVATMSDYPIADPIMRPNWSDSTPFEEMSCGSGSHMATNSMLNFSNGGGSNLRLNSPAMMMMVNMNKTMNNQIGIGERQRLM